MGLKKRKRFFTLLASAAAIVYLISTSGQSPAAGKTHFRNLASATKQSEKGFIPLQLSGVPSLGGSVFSSSKPVYGMSLGGMVHQQNISGVSIAGIHAFTKKKQGLSFSFMDICKESRGASFFAAGGAERNYGFAAGLVNLAEHNSGMQLGIINQVYPEAVIENEFKKPEKPQGFGVQAGIINYSEGRGLQFGLWNTNSKAWIKHFPFFNFAL